MAIFHFKINCGLQLLQRSRQPQQSRRKKDVFISWLFALFLYRNVPCLWMSRDILHMESFSFFFNKDLFLFCFSFLSFFLFLSFFSFFFSFSLRFLSFFLFFSLFSIFLLFFSISLYSLYQINHCTIFMFFISMHFKKSLISRMIKTKSA